MTRRKEAESNRQPNKTIGRERGNFYCHLILSAVFVLYFSGFPNDIYRLRRLATHRNRAPRTRVPAYNSLSLPRLLYQYSGRVKYKKVSSAVLCRVIQLRQYYIHPAIETQYSGIRNARWSDWLSPGVVLSINERDCQHEVLRLYPTRRHGLMDYS